MVRSFGPGAGGATPRGKLCRLMPHSIDKRQPSSILFSAWCTQIHISIRLFSIEIQYEYAPADSYATWRSGNYL